MFLFISTIICRISSPKTKAAGSSAQGQRRTTATTTSPSMAAQLSLTSSPRRCDAQRVRSENAFRITGFGHRRLSEDGLMGLAHYSFLLAL